MYAQIEARGGDTKTFLEDQQKAARDNGRTPFQWDGSRNAGFTTGDPWLKIHDNHCSVNRAVEENERGSILNFVRRLIGIRKEHSSLIAGDYTLIDSPAGVYVYRRDRYLVVLNFSNQRVWWQYSFGAPVVISNNYQTIVMDEGSIYLMPAQALILRLI
jgi:oligo-1,6-glucosidase